MRRILFFLLVFPVATDAIYCLALRPRPALQEMVRLPTSSEVAALRQRLAESSLVRHVLSGDWLQPPPLEPLELVPEDALLMIDAQNAGAAGQALLASRFGQTVAAIPWPAVLKQLGVPSFWRLLLERQLEEAKSLLATPLLQDILSQRTVLALLPPASTQQLRANPLPTLLEQTLLLAAPKEAAALLNMVKAASKQPELLYHQGVGILIFDLKQGRKLHVAMLGGRLAFSLGLQPVQRSIDGFVRHFFFQQTGLLRSRDYAAMKAATQGKDDFFLYADLARLWPLLHDAEAAEALPAFRSLSLFHQGGSEVVQVKAAVRFTPDLLPSVQKEILAMGPVLNHTLGKMPASLPFYVWSGWLEPSFWQQALAIEGQQERVEQAEAWFKAQTGLSLSELLSLFGREFSVNIAEISTAGFFPVPRLCFVFEIREQKKAERLLARLIAGLPTKSEKVAGTRVVSLQAAKGMLQPSYAFTDGFLLLADSREQLVDILAGQTERMAQSKAFQGAAGKPANLMLFVRAAQLVDGLKELAAWAGTMTAINDEQAGAKSKVLIDQVVIPLLDSLSACGAISVRSEVRPGELVVEATALPPEEQAPQAVQTEN
jgi:hypothetical protein